MEQDLGHRCTSHAVAYRGKKFEGNSIAFESSKIEVLKISQGAPMNVKTRCLDSWTGILMLALSCSNDMHVTPQIETRQ